MAFNLAELSTGLFWILFWINLTELSDGWLLLPNWTLYWIIFNQARLLLDDF